MTGNDANGPAAGADATGRVWFVSGASSGFGRAITEAVLEHGDRTVVTARDVEKVRGFEERYPGKAKAVALDVTDSGQARAAVGEALDAFGRIDVVVNNAGYGLLGALEELSDEEIRAQMETNFFGAANVTRAALPHMRERRSGHVVNVSSEGGMTGVPGASAYNASKFALEGMSEALSMEAAHLGIKVTIVEPGALRTDWAGRSLRQAECTIEDYAPSSGRVRELVPSTSGRQPGDPEKAAKAIIAAVEAEEPPLRLVLGEDAVEHVSAKLEKVRVDMAAWEETSRSIAFEESHATT
jgi:NAD(P)-dependent dehydrogenase (short-subunit alcohol dehydrogenase family)